MKVCLSQRKMPYMLVTTVGIYGISMVRVSVATHVDCHSRHSVYFLATFWKLIRTNKQRKEC